MPDNYQRTKSDKAIKQKCGGLKSFYDDSPKSSTTKRSLLSWCEITLTINKDIKCMLKPSEDPPLTTDADRS